MKVKLTPFQTQEVEHGMSIDSDMGRVVWGTIEYTSKKKQWGYLHITNLAAALYRITSSRDIWQDNADSWGSDAASYRSGANSLVKLVKKIVAEAGGRAAVLALPQTPWGGDETTPDEFIGGSDLERYI